jgi:hypothetical protein
VVVGSGGGAVVADGAAVVGIGVVAGRAGDCTRPIELLPHALARAAIKASVPTMVVFMLKLLVAWTWRTAPGSPSSHTTDVEREIKIASNFFSGHSERGQRPAECRGEPVPVGEEGGADDDVLAAPARYEANEFLVMVVADPGVVVVVDA